MNPGKIMEMKKKNAWNHMIFLIRELQRKAVCDKGRFPNTVLVQKTAYEELCEYTDEIFSNEEPEKDCKKGRRLFVWEGDGVFQDNYSGMIVILAHDLEEAMQLMDKKYPEKMGRFNPNGYRIIEDPEAFAISGGA